MASDRSNIKVAIRIRPALRDRNSTLQFRAATGAPEITDLQKSINYRFDEIFDVESTNRTVFERGVQTIVDSCVEGFNGTIFAYGQTASGKTHTMQGHERDEGMIRLSVRELFSQIKQLPSKEFQVSLTYLEVYNEKLIDLIAATARGSPADVSQIDELGAGAVPNSRPPKDDKDSNVVKIAEGKNGVIEAVGASVVVVRSVGDVSAVLRRCEKARHVSGTAMNERSSRSHTILSIKVQSRDVSNENELSPATARLRGTTTGVSLRVGLLHLVDLAGSEGISRAQTEGHKRAEGAKINQSLLALTKVISQIVLRQTKSDRDDGARFHINYRDSKLTRLLMNSLGGNSKTAVICCISPEALDYRESLSTLDFASRAKCIKNKARVNVILAADSSQRGLEDVVEKLRQELHGVRQELFDLQVEKLEWRERNEAQLTSRETRPKRKRSMSFHCRESHAQLQSTPRTLSPKRYRVSGEGASIGVLSQSSWDGSADIAPIPLSVFQSRAFERSPQPLQSVPTASISLHPKTTEEREVSTGDNFERELQQRDERERELEGQLDRLIERIEEMTRESFDLNNEMKEVDRLNSELRRRMAEMDTEMEEEKKERMKLEMEVKCLEEEMGRREEEVKRGREKIEELNQEMKRKDEKVERANEQVKQLEQQKKRKEEEAEQTNEQLKQLDQKMKRSEEESTQKLQTLTKELEAKTQSLEEAINVQNSEREKHKIQLLKKEGELDEERQKCKDVLAAKLELTGEEIRAAQVVYEVQIEELKKKVEETKTEWGGILELEKARYVAEYEKQVKNEKDKAAAVKKDLLAAQECAYNLEGKLEERDRKAREAHQELTAMLKSKMRELEETKHLADVRVFAEQQYEIMKQQNSVLQTEKSKLQADVARLSLEVDTTENEKRQLEELFTATEKQQTERIFQLREKVGLREKEFESLKEQTAAAIKAYKSENTDLGNSLTHLKQQLEAKSTDHDVLALDLHVACKRMTEVSESKDELQDLLEEKRREFESFQTDAVAQCLHFETILSDKNGKIKQSKRNARQEELKEEDMANELEFKNRQIRYLENQWNQSKELCQVLACLVGKSEIEIDALTTSFFVLFDSRLQLLSNYDALLQSTPAPANTPSDHTSCLLFELCDSSIASTHLFDSTLDVCTLLGRHLELCHKQALVQTAEFKELQKEKRQMLIESEKKIFEMETKVLKQLEAEESTPAVTSTPTVAKECISVSIDTAELEETERELKEEQIQKAKEELSLLRRECDAAKSQKSLLEEINGKQTAALEKQMRELKLHMDAHRQREMSLKEQISGLVSETQEKENQLVKERATKIELEQKCRQLECELATTSNLEQEQPEKEEKKKAFKTISIESAMKKKVKTHKI